MDVEKVELLQTLKSGEDVWPKGRVFDKKDGPFPPSITAEIRAHMDKKSWNVIKILMTSADVKQEEARIRQFEVDKAVAVQAQIALEKEKETLMAEVELLKKENKDLEVDKAVAVQAQIALEKEKETLMAEVELLKKENKDLEDEIALLKSELIDLKNESKKIKGR